VTPRAPARLRRKRRMRLHHALSRQVMTRRAEPRRLGDEERARSRRMRPVAFEALPRLHGSMEDRSRPPDPRLEPGVARQAQERGFLAEVTAVARAVRLVAEPARRRGVGCVDRSTRRRRADVAMAAHAGAPRRVAQQPRASRVHRVTREAGALGEGRVPPLARALERAPVASGAALLGGTGEETRRVRRVRCVAGDAVGARVAAARALRRRVTAAAREAALAREQASAAAVRVVAGGAAALADGRVDELRPRPVGRARVAPCAERALAPAQQGALGRRVGHVASCAPLASRRVRRRRLELPPDARVAAEAEVRLRRRRERPLAARVWVVAARARPRRERRVDRSRRRRGSKVVVAAEAQRRLGLAEREGRPRPWRGVAERALRGHGVDDVRQELLARVVRDVAARAARAVGGEPAVRRGERRRRVAPSAERLRRRPEEGPLIRRMRRVTARASRSRRVRRPGSRMTSAAEVGLRRHGGRRATRGPVRPMAGAARDPAKGLVDGAAPAIGLDRLPVAGGARAEIRVGGRSDPGARGGEDEDGDQEGSHALSRRQSSRPWRAHPYAMEPLAWRGRSVRLRSLRPYAQGRPRRADPRVCQSQAEPSAQKGPPDPHRQ